MSQPVVRAQRSDAPAGMEAAHTVAHNLRIASELSSVLRALEDASVPCVVLKGIPLVHRIGEGLSARRIADNDVLVRRTDVARAIRVLEPLGYASAAFRNLEQDLEDNFEHPLIRVDDDGTFLVCELHWNAFQSGLFRVSEELLWARTMDVEVGGMRVKVFEPSLQLLHLAAHAIQHELCEPRTLRTFGLAWTRWSREVSYDDLARLARAIGLELVLEYVIRVTRNLRLTDGPEPARRSRRVDTLLRLLDSRRLLVNAEDAFPERYLRLLATTLLVSPPRGAAHLLGRSFPRPDWVTRRRGPIAIVRHYAARPVRPVLRSLGWRPGSDGPRARRTGMNQARAVLAYLRIHRELAARYAEVPLDELLGELETAGLGERGFSSLSLDELARAIGTAERLAPRLSPTPNTCLYRALARYALLQARAHPVSFVLGLGQPLDQPGHAWVEVAGQPFLEPRAPSFPRILTRASPSSRGPF